MIHWADLVYDTVFFYGWPVFPFLRLMHTPAIVPVVKVVIIT